MKKLSIAVVGVFVIGFAVLSLTGAVSATPEYNNDDCYEKSFNSEHDDDHCKPTTTTSTSTSTSTSTTVPDTTTSTTTTTVPVTSTTSSVPRTTTTTTTTTVPPTTVATVIIEPQTEERFVDQPISFTG